MIPNGKEMNWNGHHLVFESEPSKCVGCFFDDKNECPECDEGVWVEDSPWHTGTPTKETNEDNEYCYAIMFYYDGWYLSDYLFKANHKEGCFETSPRGDEKPIKFKFSEDNPPFHTAIRWQKITPYEEKKDGIQTNL